MTASTMATSRLAAEEDTDVVAGDRLARLTRLYAEADTFGLLERMIQNEFPGRIALVSSFGTEAAVLLHMVAGIDKALPVIFLNTGKLFGETLRYRDALIGKLGLTDVRGIHPDSERVEHVDPDGVLWYGNPDMCCFLRKVEPLRRAIVGFDALITGRKAFHGGARAGLARVELGDDQRFRVNPLANWTKADVDAYFEASGLPRHPLEAEGYLSIGCMPCTDRVVAGEGMRAGRWRGQEKTECGIHLPIANWKINGID